MSVIVRLARMKAKSRTRGALLLLIIGAAMFVVLFRAVVAEEQLKCDRIERMVSFLALHYGEMVVAEDEFEGDEARKLILLRNPSSGTWTIIYAWANGVSCYVTSGQGSITPVRT